MSLPSDIQPLFAERKKIAGKKPATLITDGERHFIKPIKKELWTKYTPEVKYIRESSWAKKSTIQDGADRRRGQG